MGRAIVGLREDGRDGLAADRGDGVVVIDDDALEQGTVEYAAFSGIALGIEVVETGEDVQGLVESGASLTVGRGQTVEAVIASRVVRIRS